ncbi:MAG: VWA domain-containing protein [Fuerstiella sp.]
MLKSTSKNQRKGASAVLVAAMLFVFVICTALTVDVAYMQLIRTELRVATDAAAKAAAETLATTEDMDEALETAKSYAANNSVGGQPFQIDDSDVEFGRVTRTSTGRYVFAAGARPENAVNIQGRLAADARTKPIALFFAPALGHADFSTSHSATASQQDVEVCLCLDRSGSMLFDLSGQDWVYPPNNPLLSSFTAWGSLWRNHLSAPHPDDSRWAVLADAVHLFLVEAGRYDAPPRTSLVTWGADTTMPISPRTRFLAATVDVQLPASGTDDWQSNANAVESAINALGAVPMMGGTNMNAGLNQAVSELSGSSSSGLANKIIILLSDGVWNTGGDPVQAAQAAKNLGITVHTISMLSRDQETLEEIAAITGGRFFSASDDTELAAAFFELARTLPVVLTD